jgi:hypothetical protein
MRYLTIQDVIKAIPMDEELRKEVLYQYDSYDEPKKFQITKVCWEAFTAMEDTLKSYYEELIMQEVAAGTKTVDNINDAVQQAVEQDIEDRIIGKQQDTEQLETIRKQLENLMGSTHTYE